MGYWSRRLAKEKPTSESEQDLVFVRLPSEQEAAGKLLSEESSPVRIFISDSIRIEISDFCRPELMEALTITEDQYRMLMQGLEIVARNPISEVTRLPDLM